MDLIKYKVFSFLRFNSTFILQTKLSSKSNNIESFFLIIIKILRLDFWISRSQSKSNSDNVLLPEFNVRSRQWTRRNRLRSGQNRWLHGTCLGTHIRLLFIYDLEINVVHRPVALFLLSLVRRGRRGHTLYLNLFFFWLNIISVINLNRLLLSWLRRDYIAGRGRGWFYGWFIEFTRCQGRLRALLLLL